MKDDTGEEKWILSCRSENGKEQMGRLGRSSWVGRLEIHSKMDEYGRTSAV